MKVYAIIGKDPKNSNEKYLVGILSDENKAIAQKNYLSYGFNSDYYVEEREI